MLSVKNLVSKVDSKIIIDNLTYKFEENRVYAIMGPNGSGKSTLAHTIMGNPVYQTDNKSKIIFHKKNIIDLSADKRASLGIFLSFQQPLSLSGVNVFQYMLYSMGKRKSPIELRKEIKTYANELGIKEELLGRSLNEDFSGGEKKKMEIIQMAVLDPEIVIFDEIDTGVDIDSLKKIMNFLSSHRGKATYIFITHYNRIFSYIKPDTVLVMKEGKIIKEGDYSLAEKIEREGYGNL